MDSDFVRQPHFTSLHTLEESGEAIRRRQIGSELDLNNFACLTVEDPVSQVIQRLYEDKNLRDRFGLRGSVQFENQSNTLSPDVQRRIFNLLASRTIRVAQNAFDLAHTAPVTPRRPFRWDLLICRNHTAREQSHVPG
jgi:hypothetical protein